MSGPEQKTPDRFLSAQSEQDGVTAEREERHQRSTGRTVAQSLRRDGKGWSDLPERLKGSCGTSLLCVVN